MLLAVPLPSIDFIQYGISFCFSMFTSKIFAHPFNKMVFKYSLYKLVKQIRCDELVYISDGEVVGEWLDGNKFCV